MKKNHVRVGDKIQVISGNQKGIIGTITSVLKKNSLVYIDAVSPRFKKLKASKGGETKEIRLDVPIHISNVMMWDTKTNEASRIGYKIVEEKKFRYFKKSGNLI